MRTKVGMLPRSSPPMIVPVIDPGGHDDQEAGVLPQHDEALVAAVAGERDQHGRQ
jgi:hypothetical protein